MAGASSQTSEILTSFWVGYLKNSARDAGVGWKAFTTMAPHESLLPPFHPTFNKLTWRREVGATMSLRGTESTFAVGMSNSQTGECVFWSI